jgi:hypothetical protein
MDTLKPEYLETWRRRFAAQEVESRALAAEARRVLPEPLLFSKDMGPNESFYSARSSVTDVFIAARISIWRFQEFRRRNSSALAPI